MPRLMSIAVEHPEDYMQKIPLRTLAIDADGNVWRGEATIAPLGPTVMTWTPVTSQFPTSGEPARLLGSPEDPDEEEDDLEP